MFGRTRIFHSCIYLYLCQIESCCIDGLKLTILLSLCLASGIISICCQPDLYFHIYFSPLNFNLPESISFKFGFLLYYLKYHRVPGNPTEEGQKGLQDPEGSRTPQGNSQNQLTRAPRGSQRLNQQPGSLHRTDLDTLQIRYSCVRPSLVFL